jgi:hemerythrin-like domain-containing protein
MAKILDSLSADHAGMTRVLDLLDAEIGKDDADGGPDFHVIAHILDYFLSFPDLCHHPKEDLIYRKLEERDAEAAKRVGNLVAEHDKLAGIVHKLAFTATRKALGEDEPYSAWFISMARNLLDSHRHHMKMEDAYFFPVANEVLTDDDWAEIEDQFTKYNENFLCPETQARLDEQFREIYEKKD